MNCGIEKNYVKFINKKVIILFSDYCDCLYNTIFKGKTFCNSLP